MTVNGICIITTRIGNAGFSPLINLIRAVTSATSDKVLVISSSNFKDFLYSSKIKDFQNITIEIDPIGRKNKESWLVSVLYYPIVQLKTAIKLISRKDEYDVVIFFIGSEKMLLPIAISKILNKKIAILLAGSEKNVEIMRNRFIGVIVGFVSEIVKKLSDMIFVYSPNLITEWGLHEYINKITFAYEHCIEFEWKQTKMSRKDIGFVGRLSAEKGLGEFLKAIEIIEQRGRNFKYSFIIAGDGELRDVVKKFAEKSKKLKYLGWLDKNKLYELLPQLRLLVLPSYTEGLPNIVLEAMKCKTPVVATSVGAISDVVTHGKTGYIIPKNDPAVLSEVIECLVYEPAKLRKIGHNACILVNNKFNRDYVVGRWMKVLCKFGTSEDLDKRYREDE